MTSRRGNAASGSLQKGDPYLKMADLWGRFPKWKRSWSKATDPDKIEVGLLVADGAIRLQRHPSGRKSCDVRGLCHAIDVAIPEP